RLPKCRSNRESSTLSTSNSTVGTTLSEVLPNILPRDTSGVGVESSPASRVQSMIATVAEFEAALAQAHMAHMQVRSDQEQILAPVSPSRARRRRTSQSESHAEIRARAIAEAQQAADKYPGRLTRETGCREVVVSFEANGSVSSSEVR